MKRASFSDLINALLSTMAKVDNYQQHNDLVNIQSKDAEKIRALNRLAMSRKANCAILDGFNRVKQNTNKIKRGVFHHS